eukprot:15028936-Ditylum_brightwellii.AAC.1
MMYLASNSRPEITFAVHQCAKFTHGTKHSHEKTILQICWSLKGTQSEGLIIKPNMKELLQVSKLQTEVALSTPHAEYVTLSQPLKDLLPTKDLITEVVKGM